MSNKEIRKIEIKLTKPCNLARQRTFDNQNIIELDKDISEMDTNIKQYQTITKKNLFIDDKPNIKNDLKPKSSLYRLNTSHKKSKNKNKNHDSYSLTTNTSFNDKSIKKVTFSTVEIHRVEKYKKYNAVNNYSKTFIQKNIDEVQNNTSNNDESNCFIF